MAELWQRFEVPLPYAAKPGVKPHHVFGGAALALGQPAWDLLDPLFTLTYMGAAEYEFGVLPLCLKTIADNKAKYAKHKYKDVFIVCQPESLKELQDCVDKASKNKLLVKNGACYDNPKTMGWIDIKRNAFIFKNEDICDCTCTVFEIGKSDE